MRKLLLSAFTLVVVASPGRALLRAQVIPRSRLVDGVVELQHSADAFQRAPQFVLSAKPLATLVDQASVDLTWAFDVALLSDGRIVTLARVGNHLLLFEPDGRFAKELSRKGNGPGDIMAPTGLARTRGDTLVMLDPANNRVNRVLPSKGFVSTRTMPPGAPRSTIAAVGMLRGGELVAAASGWNDRQYTARAWRQSAPVVLFNASATAATIVATVPDLELRRVDTHFRGRTNTIAEPLRLSRDAKVVAWDTVIATGSGDGYRIDLRDRRGRIHTVVRVHVARRAVSQAMRDSVVASALRELDGPHAERMPDAAEARRVARSAPFADSLPPYGGWFVTPNYTLWITDCPAPGDRRGGATAFRQDGAIVGRLSWPSGDLAIAFSDDRVVLRHVDDDGVVSLRVYELRRASP